jgi:hypothetical protein
MKAPCGHDSDDPLKRDHQTRMAGKYKPVVALLLYNAPLAGSLERAKAIDLTRMPERNAGQLPTQLKQEGLLGT